MAKKAGGKGKEKKLARKAENERAAALVQQLRELNESSANGSQLAAQYPAFQRYDRNGLTAAVHCFGASELPPPLIDWALGLTRHHMAPLYEACPEWGWSDGKKHAELSHPAARFLVVFQDAADKQAPQAQHGPAEQAQAQQQQEASVPLTAGQENVAAAGNIFCGTQQQQRQQEGGAAEAGSELGQPVAFLHFRFEAEDDEAVLYCYEIQVAAAVQGKGLGRFLMQLLELMGRRSGVARLMLTVFHDNVAATAMYRKLGYVLDADSPGFLEPSGGHEYEIMTKRLRQQGTAPPVAPPPAS
ncbi:hypothetical protein D9Q98_008396 [Chlorella vulgaris]|uniref:N-alpha-acetyltransferase 40 n=1 Tax=Chlorella vulgaris TaxID=3077 RepID=A0A9D4TGK3_CHLVU|nr:hypothetical protein D9Q98_008396 [Chlorella vulgaris]